MFSAAWLRFISVVAFTSAVISGLAAFAVYGFGYNELPPVTIGSQTIVVNLISYGYIFALIFVGSNILDAITPQVSEEFNTLGKVGSWIALGLFTITGLLVFGQMGVDGTNIRRVLQTSGSVQLLAGLWIFSMFDVFVLQRLKNHSLVSNDTHRNQIVEREVHHGEIVEDLPRLGSRSVPLIGSAPNARVFYFNCAGKDVEVIPSQIEGGDPTVRLTEPRVA